MVSPSLNASLSSNSSVKGLLTADICGSDEILHIFKGVALKEHSIKSKRKLQLCRCL